MDTGATREAARQHLEERRRRLTALRKLSLVAAVMARFKKIDGTTQAVLVMARRCRLHCRFTADLHNITDSFQKAHPLRKIPSYPPYNSVCTGYGQSCYLAFDNCSTVKGVPGTWNPGGHTPCQNEYGC